MKNKALPIFLAFLCMGFGDAVGPFVGLAQKSFNLSNTMAQLIVFMEFIMFGILSIPLGIIQDKTGKKKMLLAGLATAFLGLVIPALFGLTTYGAFLVTVLLLGAGATMLQVAGNPIMRDVSAEGKYSRNLSFSQFVKAVGSLSGPVIPAAAAYFWGASWTVVFSVFSACLFITILFVSLLKVEESRSKEKSATIASCMALLAKPSVLAMVLAIFFYVGAEVCVSSGTPIYMKSRYGIEISTVGVLGTGLFFLALTIGRFLGGVMLNWLSPKKFFAITALFSVIGLAMVFPGSRALAIAGIFITGLGFANIFPLVFSMAVDAMPERANELSGLMVTAIVGGAFLPPLMGYIADLSSPTVGFAVPLGAIALVSMLVAGFNKRKAA